MPKNYEKVIINEKRCIDFLPPLLYYNPVFDSKNEKKASKGL